MRESYLQKKGIDLLQAKGAYSFKVIQANKSGIPDVIHCVPMTKKQIIDLDQDVIGVFVAIEYKNPNGKGITSAIQQRNIKQIINAGGIAFVTDNIEQIKEKLSWLF